ncbi:MAG: sugar-binding domain-containing protein [Bifidobacterium psychraerophilum]|jgi:DNA-binding transcriptional regulator LsrR (DeoR family)|uniref:sugar-binding transcriptional regulator n=1 Tax=Bifidobacterium psychraerophilum TaxID=218140 RepID=UPI0039EBDAEE
MFIKDDQLISSSSREHVDLLLRIARRYYLDSKTQTEIAKEFGYSRASIARLLKESRERNMVHITVDHPLERLEELEQGLVERYGLHYARVGEPAIGEDPIAVVSQCAASLFVEHMRPDSLVTVSNGNAVAATVREVAPQNWEKTNVAQMIGSLSPTNPMTDSPEICMMLAQRLGGSFTKLPVPMILSSSGVAQAMRREGQIAATLALGGGADIALVGVGAVANMRSGHIFDAYVDADVVKEVVGKGAVGHICGHHIDSNGRHVHTSLCDRTISIDFERLRRIPLVIGVAWGSTKVPAIRACLLGGLISALATDRETAERLLDG